MVSIRATAILASTVISQNKQLLRQHQEIQDSVQKIILYFFFMLILRSLRHLTQSKDISVLRFLPFAECRVKVDAVVSVKTTADDTDMIVTLKTWSWSNRK